jgi:hypothetical protein
MDQTDFNNSNVVLLAALKIYWGTPPRGMMGWGRVEPEMEESGAKKTRDES